MTPRTFATECTHLFIKGYLPAKSKVLEVGCGLGDLALQLQHDGHAVTAIDSSKNSVESTKSKGVNAQCIDFLSFKDGSFDAVLFTNSLHHIFPLEKALKHAFGLLKPQGTLIIEEFDWGIVDYNTADWLYRLAKLLHASSVLAKSGLTHLGESNPLEYWKADHQHEPPLHRGNEMAEATKHIFNHCKTSNTNYLFRYFVRDLPANDQGLVLAKQIYDWEDKLICSGALKPVGLRITATR